jgi:hypothetical protein
MLFGVTRLQKGWEENGFFLLLMVSVSKSLEKLENAIDVPIIRILTVRHTVGHFADDIERTKDVLMLFHQNACGFHGGPPFVTLFCACGVP